MQRSPRLRKNYIHGDLIICNIPCNALDRGERNNSISLINFVSGLEMIQSISLKRSIYRYQSPTQVYLQHVLESWIYSKVILIKIRIILKTHETYFHIFVCFLSSTNYEQT